MRAARARNGGQPFPRSATRSYCLALRVRARVRRATRGTSALSSATQRALPIAMRRAPTCASTPRPATARAALASKRGASLSGGHDGLRQRMLAHALHGGGEPERFAPVLRGRGIERDETRPADGQRAGLVERDDPDRMRLFERLRVLDENALTRRDAGAGHDRGRRREAERARTRDHEHRDRVEQRRFGVAPCSSQPASVTSAIARIAGTNTADTRSTSR